MSVIVDTTGLGRLVGRLNRIAKPNAALLMATYVQHTLPDDNRRGILAGIDKDGLPLAPVTYRPKGPTVGIKEKSAARFRNNQPANRRGVFLGFGPHASGLHNNLARGEYEQLTGPPLAPRGPFSRVITNYTCDWEVSPDGLVWTAYGVWIDVVDVKGRKFLSHLFNGGRHLPRRDIRGLRPEGRAKARREFIAWARDQIRIQPAGFFSGAA